jgi:hypothetical protein
MVISATSDCGNKVVDMAAGVTTFTGSSGLNLVVSMKKSNNRKATSHIGVMSTVVALRAIFTFGISLLLVVHY